MKNDALLDSLTIKIHYKLNDLSTSAMCTLFLNSQYKPLICRLKKPVYSLYLKIKKAVSDLKSETLFVY